MATLAVPGQVEVAAGEAELLSLRRLPPVALHDVAEEITGGGGRDPTTIASPKQDARLRQKDRRHPPRDQSLGCRLLCGMNRFALISIFAALFAGILAIGGTWSYVASISPAVGPDTSSTPNPTAQRKQP